MLGLFHKHACSETTPKRRQRPNKRTKQDRHRKHLQRDHQNTADPYTKRPIHRTMRSQKAQLPSGFVKRRRGRPNISPRQRFHAQFRLRPVHLARITTSSSSETAGGSSGSNSSHPSPSAPALASVCPQSRPGTGSGASRPAPPPHQSKRCAPPPTWHRQARALRRARPCPCGGPP